LHATAAAAAAELVLLLLLLLLLLVAVHVLQHSDVNSVARVAGWSALLPVGQVVVTNARAASLSLRDVHRSMQDASRDETRSVC
jgi:hypothetical protein